MYGAGTSLGLFLGGRNLRERKYGVAHTENTAAILPVWPALFRSPERLQALPRHGTPDLHLCVVAGSGYQEPPKLRPVDRRQLDTPFTIMMYM